MIVDDLAARFPTFRQRIESAHIFQVPYSVCPFDDADGRPGLLWGTHIPDGLTPLAEEQTFGQRRSLDSSFADPVYSRVVLFGPGEQRGCVLVEARRATPELIAAMNVRAALRAEELARWPPRWHIEAALVWQPPLIPHPLCVISSLLLGDRVLINPAMAPVLLDNPAIDLATVRTVLTDSWRRRDAYSRQLLGVPDLRTDVIARLDERAVRQVAEETANDGAGVTNIVVTAFSLLNAKNIVQDPVVPEQSRASRRRGEPAPYRYHVLTVAVPAIRREPGASTPVTDQHVAIHWVRGHFKRYAPEKPLFGRFVGVYWWQPHLAGRASGFVDKDYRIDVIGGVS